MTCVALLNHIRVYVGMSRNREGYGDWVYERAKIHTYTHACMHECLEIDVGLGDWVSDQAKIHTCIHTYIHTGMSRNWVGIWGLGI
jgi:hypothetical protein